MKVALKVLSAWICVITAMTASALDEPPSAASVMDSAKKQAKAEKKNIFIMFDASW